MDSALAAPSFESTLAAQIVASMVQARSGQPVPGVRHPPSAKVVYMAGHDTNLVLLRKLLGLRWHTAGWAENAAPPGGMLIFELADVPGRGFEVSAYFQAARPEQLREGQDFASQAPPRSPVPIPGCPIGKELSCPFEHFRSVVLASLRTECVATEGLKDFVLAAPAPGPVPSTNWWAVLAAGVAAFALGLGLCAFAELKSLKEEASPAMIPTELASPSSLPGKAAMTLEGAENDELARGRSTKGARLFARPRGEAATEEQRELVEFQQLEPQPQQSRQVQPPKQRRCLEYELTDRDWKGAQDKIENLEAEKREIAEQLHKAQREASRLQQRLDEATSEMGGLQVPNLRAKDLSAKDN
ncbi:hypothetical protein AK812_SmicGene3879 [Symbiodinium microadriaticum]|uniref:Uncharacterized protein n=1 Tax=Symbiodinium microadriaticum TaxID=2951 RepID=A0A1Q9EXS1_SYMMI|nr:hypothetical protein AK812_SmicGene3879 [Symbiodinium microadriaticum]